MTSLLELITETVARGEDVAISGFAKFRRIDRPARMARNPATGEMVKVAAKRVARITPLKAFKDAVLTGKAPAKKAPAKKAPAEEGGREEGTGQEGAGEEDRQASLSPSRELARGPGGCARAPSPVELIRVRLPLVRPFRTAREHHDVQRRVARPCRHRRRGRMGRVLGRTGAGLLRRDARRRPARHSRPPRAARLRGPRLRRRTGQRLRPGRARSRAARRAAAATGQSLVSYLGRHAHDASRPASRSASPTTRRSSATLAAAYCAEGYRRIKLKIEPGADVAIVAAVRAEIGDDVALAVDANGSYAPRGNDNAAAALDRFALQCIEQPLAPGHDPATTASWRKRLTTPIALDESVTSATSHGTRSRWGLVASSTSSPDASAESTSRERVHDPCVVGATAALIGGMLETGIGRAGERRTRRAARVHRDRRPDASNRYFAEDVTEPWVLTDGRLPRAHRPGHRRVGAHAT